jgi:CRP-like cAMP-binding protein
MALEEDATAPVRAQTRSMTDDDMRILQAVGSESDVPAGRLLIERGQPASGLFVILEGSVIVEAPEGTRMLGPGAVVGERALVSGHGERTARVRTASDVRVLAVARRELDRLTTHSSSLAHRLLGAAAGAA